MNSYVGYFDPMNIIVIVKINNKKFNNNKLNNNKLNNNKFNNNKLNKLNNDNTFSG